MKWNRTAKQRRRDLSIRCRHHDDGLKGDVKEANRSLRYRVRRNLKQAMTVT